MLCAAQLHPAVQAEGGMARQHANERGYRHHPQVVPANDAIDNSKHCKTQPKELILRQLFRHWFKSGKELWKAARFPEQS